MDDRDVHTGGAGTVLATLEIEGPLSITCVGALSSKCVLPVLRALFPFCSAPARGMMLLTRYAYPSPGKLQSAHGGAA